MHRLRRDAPAFDVDVDSAGTGAWHVGERADPRARQVASERGVELPSIARQIDPDRDWSRFDLILAMDRTNRRDLERAGASGVRLLREFDPEGGEDVPDPYSGGIDDFESVFCMVDRCAESIIARWCSADSGDEH